MEKQWNSSVWQRSNQGDLRSLEYRIKQNASEVNIQDIGGRTPLHWAVDSNNFTTAEFLLQNGADCTIQDSAGATVLDYVDKLYIKTENLDTEKINQLRWNCFPGLIEQNEQQLTEKINWENLLAKYNGKRASAPAYFSSTEPKQKVNVGHDTAVSDDPSSSKFWNGQPVTQEENAETSGEIRKLQETQSQIKLPEGLAWAEFNGPLPTDEGTKNKIMKEAFDLITFDNDHSEILSVFSGVEFHPRFPLFQQALSRGSVWVGLRSISTSKLIGFIAATQFTLNYEKQIVGCVEVHSLVLHPSFRGKYLAPILIKQTEKEVQRLNIAQGFFTTLTQLPIKSLAHVSYYHRILDPKFLRFTPFFTPKPFQTISQFSDFYRIEAPLNTACPRLRNYSSDSDADRVFVLLNNYLSSFKIHRVFQSVEEMEEIIRPIHPDQFAFVLIGENEQLIGFIYFHLLFASIQHFARPTSHLVSANLGYLAVDESSDLQQLQQLLHLALWELQKQKVDIVICQNVLFPCGSEHLFSTEKFTSSETTLFYHIFNWHFTPVQASDIGLTFC